MSTVMTIMLLWIVLWNLVIVSCRMRDSIDVAIVRHVVGMRRSMGNILLLKWLILWLILWLIMLLILLVLLILVVLRLLVNIVYWTTPRAVLLVLVSRLIGRVGNLVVMGRRVRNIVGMRGCVRNGVLVGATLKGVTLKQLGSCAL